MELTVAWRCSVAADGALSEKAAAGQRSTETDEEVTDRKTGANSDSIAGNAGSNARCVRHGESRLVAASAGELKLMAHHS